MKCPIVVALGAGLLLSSGCTQRLGDFTFLSSKNLDLSNFDMEASADAPIDGVRASETFKACLDVQAKVHCYSWCNTRLIMSQCPSAERIAGYRMWQKLDRQVRKGERGIMIFAPRPWKSENESTGDTEQGLYFCAVHVFDVSQTDGEALPTVDVPTIEVANDGLLIALERVCVKRSQVERTPYGTSV